MNIKISYKILLPVLLLWNTSQGQLLSLNDAIQLALKQNPQIKASQLEIVKQQWTRKTSFDIPKTDVVLTHGQYNSFAKNDNNVTITQTLPFPTVWARQQSLNNSLEKNSELQKQSSENDLTYQVSTTFYQLLYFKERRRLLQLQDSLFSGLTRATSLRYKSGESNLLEKISAETQWNEIKNQLKQNDADISIYKNQLKVLLHQDADVDVAGHLDSTSYISPVQNTIQENPALKFASQQVNVAARQRKVETAKVLPDIMLGYFNQSLIGYQTVTPGQEQYFGSSKRFQGFQVGIAFPLWFMPHTARIRIAAVQQEIAQRSYESFESRMQGEYEQAYFEQQKSISSLQYYKDHAVPNADILTEKNEAAFRGGEIDYTTYLLNLRTALAIREGYLNALIQFHHSTLRLNHLTGNIIKL